MYHVFPPSCRLSTTGIRFLGVLFPPRNSASLTVGLPRHQNAMDLTGLPRSTRMRYDRGRVPALPREQRCPHDRRSVLGRRLPILNGPLLIIPTPTTRPGELP
jgi:hypothetical protein